MSATNSSQYIFSNVPGGITWTQANAKAQAQGGHMVAITSQAEEDLIKDVLANTNNAFYNFEPVDSALNGPWIGLSQAPGSPEPGGGFGWTDGEAVTYTDWHGGQPDNHANDSYAYFWNTGGNIGWADHVNDPTTINYGAVTSYVTEFNDGRKTLLATTNVDYIIGDSTSNMIQTVGAGDFVSSGGGSDRILVGGTPALIDGGTGSDSLIVKSGASIALSDATFKNVERVLVQGGGAVNMSGVTVGSQIYSQSTGSTTGNTTIVGTTAKDSIHAGGGMDDITGGAGGDAIFAGSGADTFRYNASGFGRDVIHNADIANDTFDVGALGTSLMDLHFQATGAGGMDTRITGSGDMNPGDAIILKGISVAQAQTGHFTFGGNEA